MEKLLVLIFVAGFADAARAQGAFGTDLLADRLWDDGKAEFNVYHAEEMRYGIARPAEIVHIVVKEPFNPRLRVKADGPPWIEVLKMNQVINVPTGVYSDHQMHSSFWSRSTGALLKFSMSSNDSCGNSFKLGWLENGFLRLTYHSYWDGEGDGRLDRRLPSDAVFYDELPFKLRSLRRGSAPAEYPVTLFPGVLSSRVGRPQPGPATIRVETFGSERDVEVRSASGTDRFRFDSAFPYTLKSWRRFDGSSLELQKAQRLDYWNHNRPGDESLLR
jgi:hypothetical protein